MIQTITIKQLQEHAGELLSLLSPDHDIVIEDGGKPIARLAAIENAATSPNLSPSLQTPAPSPARRAPAKSNLLSERMIWVYRIS